MTPREEEVLRWAIRFIQNENSQSDLKELAGSQSMDIPVEFMNLAEAVERLPEEIRKKYEV